MEPPPEIPGLPERFRLVERLGRGGQGQTWLALDARAEGDEAEIALKVFRLGSDTGWKAFELFERECRVLRSLDHPRIPRYLAHGGDEEHGTFWLAMQRVRGSSLEDALREGRRFTDVQLRALLEQLLDILDYLHELNPPVFHRDIKPGNVILDPTGDAWLVDFGGVREALFDKGKSTVVGTFGYMAPEQMRGDAGPAADLYSLGATVAAVASGTDASELPHAGLEIDLQRCIKPGRIRDALEAMLRADPRVRTRSVSEVRQRLEHGPRPQPGPTTAVAPAAARPLSTQGRLERNALATLPPRPRAAVVGVSAAVGVGLMTSGAPIAAAIVAFVIITMVGARLAVGILRGLQDD